MSSDSDPPDTTERGNHPFRNDSIISVLDLSQDVIGALASDPGESDAGETEVPTVNISDFYGGVPGTSDSFRCNKDNNGNGQDNYRIPGTSG